MRHFLIILFTTIVGFGNAFLVISLANTQAQEAADAAGQDAKLVFTDTFINSVMYAYRMALGDFATDEFGEVAVPLLWILFLLFTIFNMIVMLNLLIAIISDSYNKVNEVAE